MTEHDEFVWLRYPEAETFIKLRLDEFVEAMPPVQRLATSLLARTGSRLSDWVDHLVLADGDSVRRQLADLGFEQDELSEGSDSGDTVFHHPRAILPRVLLRAGSGSDPGEVLTAAIHVEDIAYFLMTRHVPTPIEGTVLSPYRRARVWAGAAWERKEREKSTVNAPERLEFLVVERRGHRGFRPIVMPPDYPQRYLRAYEQWATRPRHCTDERQGMEQTLALAQNLVGEMGTDLAAWIAFAAEREYWQRRNRAGQAQKARQDSLGLGWANHDHHTFRSSRSVFHLLIQILETFGFHARERFYAGAEAGWGAQVMEQSNCRFAVFADVDLSPAEVEGDFAHRPLPAQQELGTVGLWCGLHGEAMLAAGLHHLAGNFDFEAVTTGLAGRGIGMMQPFSEFSYLRQAFTDGERWAVTPVRLDRLTATGQISAAQRAQFAERGALGSHLENIQRGEGFKGFNQQRISDIIRRTDPRA